MEDRRKTCKSAVEEEKDEYERKLADVRQEVDAKQYENLTMIADMNHLQASTKEATLVAVLTAKVNLMKALEEVRAKWDVQKKVDKWVKTYPSIDFGVDSFLPKPSLSNQDDESDEEAAVEARDEAKEASPEKPEEDASTEQVSSVETAPTHHRPDILPLA